MRLSLTHTAIAIGAAFCIGSALGSMAAARYVNGLWQAKVTKQKLEAATALQFATQRVLEIERANDELAQRMEKTYAETKQKLNSKTAEYRRLAVQRGLRDPYAASCSAAMPASGPPASGVDGDGNGRLSTEATAFLQSEAARAEAIAAKLDALQNWIEETRGE